MSVRNFHTEQLAEQLPRSLRHLMDLERFHLHRTDYFFAGSPLDPSYLPCNSHGFRLPCYWIPRHEFYVYGHSPTDGCAIDFSQKQGFQETILFPVHPAYAPLFKHYLADVGARDACEDGLCIWAIPTSSVRTLLAWPDGEPERAVFVKVSLHDPLMGDRRLYRPRVAQSVGTSDLVVHSHHLLPPSFGYFPEYLGLVPRLMPDCGVLVRGIPAAVKENRILLAPLFALLSESTTDHPYFATVVATGGMSARALIEEVLCESFARLWLELTLGFGLLLESHGQDVLLALTPSSTPISAFYFRDFEALQVDWSLRRIFALAEPRDMPYADSFYSTYRNSLYYWGLVSERMRWSLYSYLHFVLVELDESVRGWQRRGIIQQNTLGPTPLTTVFSRRLIEVLASVFGNRFAHVEDIYREQRKFLKSLMSIRRELLSQGASSGAMIRAGAFRTLQASAGAH